jgi:peroxiredoxin
MADLLPIGVHAPNFALPATHEQTITLHDFAGRKHVVLIFYMGDNTPD